MKKYYTFYAIAFGIIILLLTDIALRGVKIENPFRYYTYMSKSEREKEDSLWRAEYEKDKAKWEHEKLLRDTTYLASVKFEYPNIIEIGDYKFIGKPNSGRTDKYGERYRCYYVIPNKVDYEVWKTLLKRIETEVCNDRLFLCGHGQETNYMYDKPYVSLGDRYLDVLEKERKNTVHQNQIKSAKNGTVMVK